jgi:hypothetical protein
MVKAPDPDFFPPQKHSPQRPNAPTVEHSILADPSISYLAEQSIQGVSPAGMNFRMGRCESSNTNISCFQDQSGQWRLEWSDEKHSPANGAPMTAFRLRGAHYEKRPISEGNRTNTRKHKATGSTRLSSLTGEIKNTAEMNENQMA